MELWEMSASEAAEAVKRKDFKTRELVESVLKRKVKTDAKIKAFINSTGEKAVHDADEADRRGQQVSERVRLPGIPFSIKDDISWEGTATTVGAEVLKDYRPPFSASAAEFLSQNGAVMVGKTNLDQFGLGNTTRNSSFHASTNPWDNSRLPGDGSAASLAAGSSMLSLSSDAAGELRQGASYCGVVGLRPTPGRISRYGLMSYSSSFAQVGLLARTVEDMSMALELVSGKDPLDPATKDFKEKGEVIPDGNRKAALPEAVWEQIDERHYRVLKEAISVLEGSSSSNFQINQVDLPHFNLGLQAYYVIAFAETSSNLSRFDGIRFGENCEEDSQNLEEWYFKTRGSTFNQEARRRSIVGTWFLNEENYQAYYSKALQVKTLIKNELAEVFKYNRLLLLPVVPGAAPSNFPQNDFLEEYRRDFFCAPVSLAGLPSVVVPAGMVDQLPVGVQIVGAPFTEKFLLEAAQVIEQAAGFSTPVRDI